jgi:hypothetical protein
MLDSIYKTCRLPAVELVRRGKECFLRACEARR